MLKLSIYMVPDQLRREIDNLSDRQIGRLSTLRNKRAHGELTDAQFMELTSEKVTAPRGAQVELE